MNPYVPSFSRTPASSTEPAVGASVWASGSQVWNGKIGTLTAKAMPKARNSQVCCVEVRPTLRIWVKSNVPAMTPSQMMPVSISAEPSAVYRKNFTAA